MKAGRPNYTDNVIPFPARSKHGEDPIEDIGRGNVLRMLDLSKFEQPRPAVETNVSMRANIVAMVLLGILVFLATENFSRLERSNLCIARSVCMN
jgi:hypothetical protein